MKLTTKLALKFFPLYLLGTIKKELFINKCNRQIKSGSNKRKIEQAKQRLPLYIQLGCGKRIFKEWVNIDIYKDEGIDIQLNLRDPLPFETGSVNLIYNEHVLEHLFKFEAQNLFKECFRVLKIGGSIRIGVPDAEIYFMKYTSDDKEFFHFLRHLGGAKEPLVTPIDVINQMFRMGGDHLFAWDFETLKLALQQAGFKNITRYEPGKSSSPVLCLDDADRAFETLYVEAIKE